MTRSRMTGTGPNAMQITPESHRISEKHCVAFEEWWRESGLRAELPVLEMAYKEIALKGWTAAINQDQEKTPPTPIPDENIIDGLNARPAALLEEGSSVEIGSPSTFRQRLLAAVNASCSCGGGALGGCCRACEVWHRFNGEMEGEP